jgi:hypothetical protein
VAADSGVIRIGTITGTTSTQISRRALKDQ